MLKCFLTRLSRPFNGEKIVVSANGTGNTEDPHAEEQTWIFT